MKFKKYSTATDTYTTLPATFQTSKTDAVENYQMYGSNSGVGEETENLFDFDTWNGVTAQRGTIERIGNSFKLTATENDAYSKTYANSDYAYEVTPNEQYTLSWNIDNPEIYGTIFVFTGENDGSTPLVTVVASVKSITFTIPNNHHFLSFRIGVLYSETSITYSNIMLVKGPTAPTTYIPFGYKIPILLESGETGNLCSNDWKQGLYAVANGNWSNSDKYVCTQNKIACDASSQYTLKVFDNKSIYAIFVLYYDVNGVHLSEYVSASKINYLSFTTPSNCAYINVDISGSSTLSVSDISQVVILKSSEYPDHYIPHRYESNYDLFLGDSKLYEDEYLDFLEQKIYRTILLTTHDNKDFITSDNNRFCVRRSNNA